jgi:hypothetical protein
MQSTELNRAWKKPLWKTDGEIVENPSLSEAMNEAKVALLAQPDASFGSVMEMHGISEDDFGPIANMLVPFILQRYGPVHGMIIGIALGVLAGQRMGLPSLDVPDSLPEGFDAQS